MTNKQKILSYSLFGLLLLIGAAIIGVNIYFFLKSDTITSNRQSNNRVQTNQIGEQLDEGETSEEEIQPLYLTTMTHLENDWAVDTNKILFEKNAEEMRYGMDLAEQYEAILTFESGLSFAEGNENFNDNVMKEAFDRGFGVGTHVDLGARTEMSKTEAANIVKEHVDAVSALVGAENNIVCSGVSAKSDWYTAAKDGGCKAVDGMVGFAYLAMPLSARPTGWTDNVILREKFHYPAPVGDIRFYPFWINSSDDFEEDIDGDLLISSGETFGLAMWTEAGGRNGDRPECGDDCLLTKEDVTILIADLKDFAAGRDTTKIGKYNVYLPNKLFVPENEDILKQFFSEMKKLQDEGVIQWASQKDIYEAKLAEKK